jgi:hypothetical protein
MVFDACDGEELGVVGFEGPEGEVGGGGVFLGDGWASGDSVVG